MGTSPLSPLDQLLAWAQANGLDDSGLARYLEVTPQNIYNWKQRGNLPAAQLVRVAQITGLTWDVMPSKAPAAPKSATYPQGIGQPHTLVAHEESPKHLDTPIIRWEELMSIALPPRFKVVLEDLSLSPRLAPGDELVFDRSDTPVVGRIALIRHPSGVHVVRWIREKLPGQYTAYSTNPMFEPLELGTEMRVVGICTEIRIMNPTMQSF